MTALRIAWLRFLDRVRPRPGIGGPSPRVSTATPEMVARMVEIIRLRCNHEWLYKEREPGETYTGYCEWCPLCGVIRQIPQ